MKNTKVLIADLDGTLMFRNNGKPYFKEEDIKALDEFRAKGNIVVINSGRNLSWLTLPLENNLEWDYLIAGSGSCIVDNERNFIYEQELFLETIKEIIEAYPTNFEITFYTSDWVYTLNQTKEHSLPVKKMKSLNELKNEKYYGFSYHFYEPKDAQEFAEWLKKSKFKDVDVFVNTKDVDIVKKGCSKGIAIEILRKYLNLDKENIYAVGDAHNDIEMLKASVNSFTFYESDDIMKQYAKQCINSVAELIELIDK